MLRPSGQVKSNFYSTMPCYLLFRQPISNVKKDISITETCLFFHVNLGEEANTTITGHNTTDDAQPNVRWENAESGKRENEANLQPIRKPRRPGEDSCPVLLESGIFAGHRHLCVILTEFNMDFQNRAGGKTGSGGVASWSESNRDRRERLRQLALETIDLNKVKIIYFFFVCNYENVAWC